jgi:type IV pilus assembly protein PilY1
MLNAKTATELQTALQAALTSIISCGTSTSASIATNSTRLDTDTLIYQAKFDSTN